jgi:GntR family transcriptional regulator of arabinose operon
MKPEYNVHKCICKEHVQVKSMYTRCIIVDIKPFSDYDLLPVYMRVADDLRSKLGSDGFAAGQLLPGEHELSKAYNLSRGTIRKALDVLASENLISRQPGRGTIILPPQPETIEQRRTIAVLWSIVRWIGADMLASIEQHLSAVNCDILFSTSQHEPEKEAQALERLFHTKLDGLILYATGDDQNTALINAFIKKNIPVVLLDRFTPLLADKLSWVTSENFHGAYELTNHLINLQHERIAYVVWTPDNESISTLRERQQGYETAITEAGLAPLILIQCGADPEGQEKQLFAETLFEFIDTQQPTALFFHNDATVYRLYPFFRDWGIRIPEDISVVGFDGLEIQFGLTPFDLTTARQDFTQLGYEAAHLLCQLIESPQQQPIHVRVPVALHIGNTTAAPRQNDE